MCHKRLWAIAAWPLLVDDSSARSSVAVGNMMSMALAALRFMANWNRFGSPAGMAGEWNDRVKHAEPPPPFALAPRAASGQTAAACTVAPWTEKVVLTVIQIEIIGRLIPSGGIGNQTRSQTTEGHGGCAGIERPHLQYDRDVRPSRIVANARRIAGNILFPRRRGR